METTTEYISSRSPARRPSALLALGSLVFGLIGLTLSFLLVGAGFAFVGLLLGCWHLLKYNTGRDMAVTGTCIALAGLLYSVVFAGVYHQMGADVVEEVEPSFRGPELVETGSAFQFTTPGSQTVLLRN